MHDDGDGGEAAAALAAAGKDDRETAAAVTAAMVRYGVREKLRRDGMMEGRRARGGEGIGFVEIARGRER
jgi:hypothetical protein